MPLIAHSKWLLVCFVNFTSIIKKMKGPNCNIIIMIHGLDTSQIPGEVNIKTKTFIPCLSVYRNISTWMVSLVPPDMDLQTRRTRSTNVQLATSYSSNRPGALTTQRLCPCCLPPRLGGTSSQQLLPLCLFLGPALRAIASERLSPSTHLKEHACTHTPLAHSLPYPACLSFKILSSRYILT